MCVKRITIVGKFLHISLGKFLHIFKLSANVQCSSLPAVGRVQSSRFKSATSGQPNQRSWDAGPRGSQTALSYQQG